MATGDAKGNNKTGIKTSLNPACNVMPEIKQPTDTIALVPINKMIANKKKEKSAGRFKKIKNGIINNSSDIKTNRSAEITFAK
jgi:hypothetical protein